MKFILIAVCMMNFAYAANTKKTMHKALQSIVEVIPYTSYSMKFNDPKNQATISGHLQNILDAFRKSDHDKKLNSPGFQPSFVTIKNHLQETVDTFNSTQKDYAYLQVKNIGNICLSCHTQLPKDKKSSFSLGIKKIDRKKFENLADYGEFLMVVRQYRKAEQIFLKVIKERTDKLKAFTKEQIGSSDKGIDNAISRLLTIKLKIYRDIKGTKKLIADLLKNKYIPKVEMENLKEWRSSLANWKKDTIKVSDEKSLDNFINKHLEPLKKEGGPAISGEDDMHLLITSGVLSNYLYNHSDGPEAGKVLYWLGVIENALSRNLFLALGDIYLKSCIEKYPKEMVAKLCYQEYEDQITFKFTGSSGTHIPGSVKKELEKLKASLK